MASLLRLRRTAIVRYAELCSNDSHIVFSVVETYYYGHVVVSGGVVDRNCSLNTDGRTMSCYTCMGRDLENCLHGLTCCKGSCFKLVDDGKQ
ncbi:unnamed protein product [Nippostrongylus brasiliensis]|uniref:Gnk2-homologous domain-containing protein n=1 Tax=Nippostrongylus brasiliensis TaxID=27835 RepID=A0A0N4XI74_NIPBR|nr:unnamed protein product [Nippostrongylus brasiliensis]